MLEDEYYPALIEQLADQVPITPFEVVESIRREHYDRSKLNISYFSEGGANVIWSLCFPPPPVEMRTNIDCIAPVLQYNLPEMPDLVVETATSDRMLEGSHMLRTRKAVSTRKSVATTTQEYSAIMGPLFRDFPRLLPIMKVTNLSPHLWQALNEELKHISYRGHVRPAVDHGLYLPELCEEPNAILMSNLLAPITNSGPDSPLRKLEFKPKWLTNSSSATRGSESCRTCSINAQRRHVAAAQAKTPGEHTLGRGDSGFCPLDLLSDDTERFSAVMFKLMLLLDPKVMDPNEKSVQHFTGAFKTSITPVLLHLRDLQRKYNLVGLTDFEALDIDVDEQFQQEMGIAMALRDCSILAIVEVKEDEVIFRDVNLLDLDIKDADKPKRQKWASIERLLIEEGWYESGRVEDCALS